MQTKEEVAELETEPEMPNGMEGVEGGEDAKCSLRKASPFWKRTGNEAKQQLS